MKLGVHVAFGDHADLLHVLHHSLETDDAELVLEITDSCPHALSQCDFVVFSQFFVTAPGRAPLQLFLEEGEPLHHDALALDLYWIG